jgi:hypothetical protein
MRTTVVAGVGVVAALAIASPFLGDARADRPVVPASLPTSRSAHPVVRHDPRPPARRANVGGHGDLPALLPTVRPNWADARQASFGGATWTLEPVGTGGGADTPPYRLTRSSRGDVLGARIPHGWAPQLFRTPVRLSDREGLVISQEGGDSDTWRVYVAARAGIQPVPTQGPLALGGGFANRGGTQVAYLSWLTPHGDLFTRVGTTDPGHFRVWQWRPTAHDTLVALDLGTVCMDDDWTAYGTCS